ncbi:MAG: methylenetetrahydrofolate--tRNA-(uracil(54)-C(5))-methyltransferase (FADH(2)-oxidizing) TrmFO [Gemmatimonadetes bacterium]|nr:methylenetetrahydrofolate--tRNA-(uracil(54)-C(5))-methyltransferase (FADH(2)-oxidizing) TrmFO [Gemmatimonadota bacterium]
MAQLLVVGGGLAGCEAAWQLAERGHRVSLLEMRPAQRTPAHGSDRLAELVCTNSLKSEELSNAHGLLKAEMRALGSVVLRAADAARLPAGTALAVDRDLFSANMTDLVTGHANIRVERREMTTLPEGPAIVATGPLTSDALSESIAELLGDDGLAFYDAIAPIVSHDSIDLGIAFFASRYGKGAGEDYLNCPLNREEYAAFLAALRAADSYPGHEWENIPYFEGCLPVEAMAARGEDTLRFGPMKPVGLSDPRTGREAYAVVQLRREDRAGRMWNLVGFQTRLRTAEQRRVLRMIPGLAEAEFLRYGSIHRNTYLNFPGCLSAWGAPASRPDLIFAGQLTGVEGYTESSASGILAGINLDRMVRGQAPVVPPATTMLGGLCRYLRQASPSAFQPMNSNFGLLDGLDREIRDRTGRRELIARRALLSLEAWLREQGIEPIGQPLQPAGAAGAAILPMSGLPR